MDKEIRELQSQTFENDKKIGQDFRPMKTNGTTIYRVL